MQYLNNETNEILNINEMSVKQKMETLNSDKYTFIEPKAKRQTLATLTGVKGLTQKTLARLNDRLGMNLMYVVNDCGYISCHIKDTENTTFRKDSLDMLAGIQVRLQTRKLNHINDLIDVKYAW